MNTVAPASLKVFLCYSSNDRVSVQKLYQKLAASGIDTWLDEERLLPGQDWQARIYQAIRDADIVVVCLSSFSVTEEGYVQKEIKFALDKADEKPDGTIFIIPTRLDDCNLPTRLKLWQSVDLFDGLGYGKLMKSLAQRAELLGRKLLPVDHISDRLSLQIWGGIEFVHIPAGHFLIGSKDGNQFAFDHEKPEHEIELQYDFYIGHYPITNAQYNLFIEQTQPENKRPNTWQKRNDCPAVNISWYAAISFCQWLNETRDKELPQDWHFRLPTEAEWEKSARGRQGVEWPWGNEWNSSLCNSSESGIGTTTPVGVYSPSGDSPYGVSDMAGNVWEWTLSIWGTEANKPSFKYPYLFTDGREKIMVESNTLRVLRGGPLL